MSPGAVLLRSRRCDDEEGAIVVVKYSDAMVIHVKMKEGYRGILPEVHLSSGPSNSFKSEERS